MSRALSGRPRDTITRVLAVVGLTLGAACAVPALDIAAKTCPCAVGWTCDTRLNVCVEDDLGDRDLMRSALDGGRDTVADPGPMEVDDGTAPPEGGPSTRADAASHLDAQTPSPDAKGPSAPDAGSPCEGLAKSPVLYDEFESDHIGLTEGAAGTSNFDRTSSFAHSGSGALRVQVTYPTVALRAAQTLAAPITDGTFYLQTFLFMDPSVTPVSITTLAFYNEPSKQGMRLLHTDEGMKLQVDAAQTTLSLMPITETIGRWMKVEVVTKLGLEGEVTVCIDGHQAAYAQMNTLVDGGYSRVELGVVRIPNTQGSVILYADDFALEHTSAETP